MKENKNNMQEIKNGFLFKAGGCLFDFVGFIVILTILLLIAVLA